jgi:acetyl-CoA carboxylase carboxyl transferase alpha subunit
MKQAAKFRRPVITLVDTPGAYPGKEAEERGQGQAIASCIRTMSRLPVPLVSVFVGEGGSGGALAFAVSDRTIMLENSIYSILSPEGFASILWHDASRWEEACEVMKLTAGELREIGICHEVITEPDFRRETAKDDFFKALDGAIWRNLEPLLKRSGEELVRKRYRELGLLERRNGGN